eukprot:CAMPEP_0202708506 /NCGR_PEP_ID=MMETSP1385-20130828/20694_1 /ASSEMBLY_ACC=CAM_ASM_000861 /TAXON_ID=933848 /ORGANISM="Elphidium margaritaceum" /LENGTH=370 /DNA_ID=CAMNT_0049367495 /DNA_START=42 /DNA_END=1154 /DNA_ORIENTATION=-
MDVFAAIEVADMYYVDKANNDQQCGPVTRSRLTELIESGVVSQYTPIWNGQDIALWTQVRNVPEFSHIRTSLSVAVTPVGSSPLPVSSTQYSFPNTFPTNTVTAAPTMSPMSPAGSHGSPKSISAGAAVQLPFMPQQSTASHSSSEDGMKEQIQFFTAESGEKWLILNDELPVAEIDSRWTALCLLPCLIVHVLGVLPICLALCVLPDTLSLIAIYHSAVITNGLLLLGLCVGLGNTIAADIGGAIGAIAACVAFVTVFSHSRWYNANLHQMPPQRTLRVNHQKQRIEVQVTSIVFGFFHRSVHTRIDTTAPIQFEDAEFLNVKKEHSHSDDEDADHALMAGTVKLYDTANIEECQQYGNTILKMINHQP